MSVESPNPGSRAPVGTDLLVETLHAHYQQTYDITLRHWNERNRLFVGIVLMLGGSALLLVPDAAIQAVIIDGFISLTKLSDAAADQIRARPPWPLFQTLSVVAIFYFTFNLYHRTAFVLRNYRYLDALERQIRELTGLTGAAFTREGAFYQTDDSVFKRGAKWVYVLMLGLLLLMFTILVVVRTVQDLAGYTLYLMWVDLAGLLCLWFYFVGYLCITVWTRRPSRADAPSASGGVRSSSSS